VRVQPAVGESIAVGAMIANPVAGAVVWAAQKLFKDPLDQAFAFEYGVTGSWADPKVEKLEQQMPAKGGGKQMKIAAVQMISGPDVAPNLATAGRLIAEAAAAGASWWPCPNTFR
jgi:hypothetical protein